MKSLKIYGKGWALVAAHPLLVILKYLVNLIFGLIIASPIFAYFHRYLDRNAQAQVDDIDPATLFEFLARFDEGIGGVTAYWPTMILLFVLINLFLSAGVYHGLQRKDRLSPGELMQASTRYFGVLLGATLLGLLFVALVLAAFFAILELSTLFVEGRGMWRTGFQLYWLGAALILIGPGAWAYRVMQTTRLLACRPTAEGPSLAALPGDFAYGLRLNTLQHGTTWFLWLWMMVSLVLVFPLGWLLHQTLGGFLWGEIAAGQITVFARVAIGLAFLGGLSRLIETPEHKVVSEPEPETVDDFEEPEEPITPETFEETQHIEPSTLTQADQADQIENDAEEPERVPWSDYQSSTEPESKDDDDAMEPPEDWRPDGEQSDSKSQS